MIKLYENIKYYRKLNNWSQEELAKKMGYTDRSMIAKIESGKVDLAQSKIIDFANVFGIEPGDLMGWDDTDAPEHIKKYVEYVTDSIVLKEYVNKLREMPDEYRQLAFTSIDRIHEAWKATEDI